MMMMMMMLNARPPYPPPPPPRQIRAQAETHHFTILERVKGRGCRIRTYCWFSVSRHSKLIKIKIKTIP